MGKSHQTAPVPANGGVSLDSLKKTKPKVNGNANISKLQKNDSKEVIMAKQQKKSQSNPSIVPSSNVLSFEESELKGSRMISLLKDVVKEKLMAQRSKPFYSLTAFEIKLVSTNGDLVSKDREGYGEIEFPNEVGKIFGKRLVRQ